MAILAGEMPAGSAWKRYANSQILARKFKLAELLPFLQSAADWLRDGVVVIDGPIGPNGMPSANRMIDSVCARMASWDASAERYRGSEYQTLLRGDLRRHQGPRCRPSFWFGAEMFPSAGAVHVETHPTVALAMMLEQQSVATLPSRSTPRTLPNSARRVRAKSDWYWALGAGGAVSGALGVDSSRN